ncbi:MarR family winged helix-turn-helix transcriptional regulator [Streptomyces sp. NPDC002790]|uniref:MarR family winged helix-turn-helix transcriptional regulator n=1 Tax=Streptomyces sp. NPDC002790 TaxID=3154431 RepID=UPI00332556BC
MDERERRLDDFERELTLLSRHFVSSRGPRAGLTLERSAYVLLTRLQAGEPLTLKELAHTFQLGMSTISRQVGAMLDKGLVERLPDPDGGMARKYRPTPLGLDRLRVDRAINLEGAARLIDATQWTDQATRQFLTLLGELNRSIEQLEGLPLNRSGQDAKG